MRVVLNSNNIIRVLKSVWLKPGISRIEISKQLGLDKSTVTIVVNRLMELGFIGEIPSHITTYSSGRRPVGLSLREKVGAILGLEIQTSHYYAVVIDLSGTVLSRFDGEIDGRSKDIITTFLEIYRQAYRNMEGLELPLLGIGIAFSGMINPYSGIIVDSNPLGIHSPLNFCREIEAFIKVPVFIENDANCGCWAELNVNRGDRSRDFLFVLGEFRKARFFEDNTRVLAVGMGMVMGERVHYGKDFSAGEYKSPGWRSPNKTQFSISDEELTSLTDDRQIIARIQGELLKDIAYLTNVLNLGRVTFGGDIVAYMEQLESSLKEEIRSNTSYDKNSEVEITVSTFREYTVSYGAASMLIENLFVIYENPSENPWKQKVGIDLFNSFSDTVRR
jgi:ROK family/Winged helix-turn-helix DNA-binding